VINEISFVGARMFNVINNKLKSIKLKSIQIFFWWCWCYHDKWFLLSTPVKDSWIFQNIKDNVNALAPNFRQTYVQCYELNKIMW
jgi:hypothetical protein